MWGPAQGSSRRPMTGRRPRGDVPSVCDNLPDFHAVGPAISPTLRVLDLGGVPLAPVLGRDAIGGVDGGVRTVTAHRIRRLLLTGRCAIVGGVARLTPTAPTIAAVRAIAPGVLTGAGRAGAGADLAAGSRARATLVGASVCARGRVRAGARAGSARAGGGRVGRRGRACHSGARHGRRLDRLLVVRRYGRAGRRGLRCDTGAGPARFGLADTSPDDRSRAVTRGPGSRIALS
jgi:hypothetical protein